jgi:hypothetical protein
MAFGTILRPFVTFGLFSNLCGYFLVLGDFGFNAAAFAVMFGAGVKLFVDEFEELGEVGRRPTFDPIKERNDSRHLVSQFTF